VLSGRQLDEVVEQAVAWYYESLDFLMKALEEGPHRYGSVRLTPAEQLADYLTMTEESWAALFARLETRYQGFPDSRKRVEEAAGKYVKRMETLKAELGDMVPQGV